MRKNLGRVLVVLGLLLVLIAGGLYAHNQWEDQQAGAEAKQVAQALEHKLAERNDTDSSELLSPELPAVELDGDEYVGTIAIPTISIDLPVMKDWSYPKLKIAPCRQFGSSRTNDLVIAAHNYESHFGKIGTLVAGDKVIFTDMDGIENDYVVDKVEVLAPTEVDAVEHSGYDLVLYTCTYGGKTRIVVFCNRSTSADTAQLN